MPIIATNSGGGDFEIAPEGAHPAVCDMIVNLGMQPSNYQGNVTYKHKVYVRWQLPQQRITIDDKDLPMVVGSMYTLSLYKNAALRRDLVSWRGRQFTEAEEAAFDVSSLLGIPCMLSVVHNESGDKTYANVASIMPYVSADGTRPAVEGEPVLFEDKQSTPEAFEKLPKWLQDKVQDNPPVLNDKPSKDFADALQQQNEAPSPADDLQVGQPDYQQPPF